MPKLSSGLAFGLLGTLVVLGHSASILRPRYNNPPDRVKDWVAMGDSYSAGPGAGEEYDPNSMSGKCMRRDQAYGPALQRDSAMIGPDGPALGAPLFRFVACTGDETKNLLDFSNPETNQINQVHKETTFFTLSIGGNDILFKDILLLCVFGASFPKDPVPKCEATKAASKTILYGKDFHGRYNKVLNQLVMDKFNWKRDTHHTSIIYQTSYIQFFDDFTTQCDGAKFTKASPRAPKMKQDLRRAMNFMVHELNEVLQYWIDLKNAPMTYFMGGRSEMWTYVSPIHWVDVDWRYMNHRFCRDGIIEPDRDTEDTWFFHAPKLPLVQGQEQNETYLELVAERWPFTWQPGNPGEPEFDEKNSRDPDEPFDPNNPAHLLASENEIRTFHPKPAGFGAERDELKAMLYRRVNQRKLSDKYFKILCIGDFSALGEGYDYVTPDRYGFIPYLQSTLRHSENFGNKPVMHDFIGSQRTGYEGDVGHEIYPDARSYEEVSRTAASTSEFQANIGKVVPIMLGAVDMQNGTPVDKLLPQIHWLLEQIWERDPTATVLLASVPMMGYPNDDGSEWWDAQKRIIQFNAQLAAITNYWARHQRRIVYVHLSAPQSLRHKRNPYLPNLEGYHRIAHDFLDGLIQANERGFFDGDQWKFPGPNVERNSYELLPLRNNEVTDGIKCHQKRGDEAPDYDTIVKSLFRGARDQDDWINNYACNKEFVCKFTWDAETFNTSAQYPFSNGRTCITTGRDGPTHLTAHQLVVRRESLEDDLSDWCKNNLRDILDRCVKDGNGYGGYWGNGKRAIHLSNVLYRDSDTTKSPSTMAQKNWRSNYPPYEEAMERIKNGGDQIIPDLTGLSDVISDAAPWSPRKPDSYNTFDPNEDAPPPQPPRGDPKSLQIVYETFISEGAEAWQKWHFFESDPGQAVDPCSDTELFSVDNAPEVNGYDPPWIDVKDKFFRPSGYGEDCRFDGLNGKGPSGDVAWLFCPERPAIMCLEDPKKAGGKGAWKNCETGMWTRDRIPVGYCDWE